MSNLPKPPKHLSPDAMAFWTACITAYELEASHLRLLQHACEAIDGAEQHRAIVAREGATIKDRFDQPREHPSAKAQRDYMHRYQQAIKALGMLDSDPDPHHAGRPPAVIARQRSKP